jgi:hypothetical protein
MIFWLLSRVEAQREDTAIVWSQIHWWVTTNLHLYLGPRQRA